MSDPISNATSMAAAGSVDPLSGLARRLLKLNAGLAYEKLLVGKSEGNVAALQDLSGATPENIFAVPARKQTEAEAALAGLYLWHDYLEESHELSQGIHTASGSWWHAILHRREGDFGNAKYWYGQAAKHPATEAVAAAFTALLRTEPANVKLLRLMQAGTLGAGLVDWVQAAAESGDAEKLRVAVALQHQEFRTLFDWTVTAATR